MPLITHLIQRDSIFDFPQPTFSSKSTKLTLSSFFFPLPGAVFEQTTDSPNAAENSFKSAVKQANLNSTNFRINYDIRHIESSENSYQANKAGKLISMPFGASVFSRFIFPPFANIESFDLKRSDFDCWAIVWQPLLATYTRIADCVNFKMWNPRFKCRIRVISGAYSWMLIVGTQTLNFLNATLPSWTQSLHYAN